MDEKTSAAVRDILARWASAAPHNPCPDFAAKLSLVGVSEKPAYVIRLMTLYDVRGNPQDATVPFRDDAPAPAINDLWAQVPALQADFYGQEGVVKVPVSAEPQPCAKCEGSGARPCETCVGTKSMVCPDCTGRGAKACPECGGLGKMACRDCKGTGQVLTTISAMGREQSSRCPACSGTGGPPCPKCGGGIDCARCGNTRYVTCQTCGGRGALPCEDCEGRRQVLRAKAYQVEYQPLLERAVLPDPETPPGLLPDELPKADLGTIVAQAAGSELAAFKDQLGRDDLRDAAERLVKRAEDKKAGFGGRQARIIKQQLSADRIAVYSVTYEYGGKRYSCWATPLDNRVLCSDDPFRDAAARWAREGQEALESRDAARAAELFGKAAAAGNWPWLEAVGRHIAAERRQLPAGLAEDIAVGIVFLAAVLLAWAYAGSRHLFWPLAAFMALTFAGAKVLRRMPWAKPETLARSLVAPAAAAAAAALLFALVSPARRLDAREFNSRLAARFGASIPAVLSAEDQGYLKFLADFYRPLGVDVRPVEEALAANARREEAERLEAQRQEEARRKQAEEELRRKREAEAARPKISFSKKKSKAQPRKGGKSPAKRR